MGAKTVNKKLQKKLNSMRHQHNCIPEKVQVTDPGEYDGMDEYRSSKPKIEHIAIKDRKGKGKKLNKQKPWYYLTRVESITIEGRRKPPKMTHDDYIKGYLKQKIDKWERKNPKPKEDDLFYKDEYPKWITAKEEAHDRIMGQVKHHIRKYSRKILDVVFKSRNEEGMNYYRKAA